MDNSTNMDLNNKTYDNISGNLLNLFEINYETFQEISGTQQILLQISAASSFFENTFTLLSNKIKTNKDKKTYNKKNYESKRVKLIQAVDNTWNHLLSSYFIYEDMKKDDQFKPDDHNPDDDGDGLIDEPDENEHSAKKIFSEKYLRTANTMQKLMFKENVNFTSWVYRQAFNLQANLDINVLKFRYDAYIRTDDTKQFAQLSFYPDELCGHYGTYFYDQAKIIKFIRFFSKKTYLVSYDNYTDFKTNYIDKISGGYKPSVDEINEKLAKYVTPLKVIDIDLDKVESHHKELYEQKNKLAEIFNTYISGKLTGFVIPKIRKEKYKNTYDNYILSCVNYNDIVLTDIISSWMLSSNMQTQMLLQNYLLEPDSNTPWRDDLSKKYYDYITNVFPKPAIGNNSNKSGGYGENFYDKVTFNEIFYNDY